MSNAGKGQLRGNVASSQPWLQVSPRTLHLKRDPQVIELTAYPRRLPERSGRARVTISTTHGERWAINVDAFRRRFGWNLALAATCALLAVVVLARMDLLPFDIPLLTPPPDRVVRTLLQLEIEPPADIVYVDGEQMGAGAALVIEDPAVPGSSIGLRVEAAGRHSYVEELVFVDGQRMRRVIKLALAGSGPSTAEDLDSGRVISSSAPASAEAP